MIGLEALSMQGLPVDKLLLTRETEDQLADLAGNAMSSTVVGACILSALVEALLLLKKGNEKVRYGEAASVEEVDDAMDVDETSPELPVCDRVIGEDSLVFKPLDLSTTHQQTLSQLLDVASQSARLCQCEGRVDITTRPLFRCQDCGASSCKRCGGRPEHNTEPIDVVAHPRLPPSDFEKFLKPTLPMCLSISDVTETLLDKLSEETPGSLNAKRWKEWRTAVLQASSSEMRFVELKRQDMWSVVYQSPHGSLELHLHPQRPEWRFFARPKASEPANAEIRRILEVPVGRLICKDSLLSGQWAFALPKSAVVEVEIKGSGSLVPSWESRLGLTGEEFRDKKVWSEVHVSIPEADDKFKFDRDITGSYQLLDRCGTASSALHKQKDSDSSLPQLYLFFVPHRTKDSEDCFMFSTDIRRLEYGEARPVVAKLDPSWRQSSTKDSQKVECHLPFRWVSCDVISLTVNLCCTFSLSVY